jgi:hypothetical protein
MRGENLGYLNGQPQVLCETTFLPDMNRAREYGWSEEEHPSKFLPSAALADTIVSQVHRPGRDSRARRSCLIRWLAGKPHLRTTQFQCRMTCCNTSILMASTGECP